MNKKIGIAAWFVFVIACVVGLGAAARATILRDVSVSFGPSGNLITSSTGNSGSVQQAGTMTGSTGNPVCADASQNTTTSGCGATQIETLIIMSGFCTTASADGSTCTAGPFSWSKAFVDNGYALSCSPNPASGSGGNPSIALHITTKTTTGFSLLLQTGTSAAGGANTITEADCVGIHP